MKISTETLDSFLRNHERVICFGAGSIFRIMCHELKQMGKLEQVLAVTDRSFLQSNSMEVAGRKILQITQQQALEWIQRENMGILITTASWRSVADYILHNADIKDYGVYSLLKVASTSKCIIPQNKDGKLKIPPYIHCCWFGGSNMPDRLRKYMESWKKYCPNYNIKLWNEDNYDVKKIAYTKTAYENRQWAFVSDYVRMDIVYRYGGIYLDTDVEIIKCLDELRKNDGFIGTEVSGGINSGLGFGAVAGNQMIGKLRDLYLNKSIPFMTNMGKETEMFVASGYQVGKGYQIIDDITVYPWQVLSPKIKEDGSMHIGKYTYAIHHYDGSWLKQ